jgi:hypothetical protein
MTTYRAYRVDERRRIISAAWVEAPDDEAAKEKAAADLCDDAIPAVELWQGTRLVDEIDCEDDD